MINTSMRFYELLEAKFSPPSIMYHGTSSAFLRSILKHGLVPKPTDKTWADDPDASSTMASRASLEGSYWTNNVRTAIGAASNTTKKFPGNKILIIAYIAERSAYADEDDINGKIKQVLQNTLNMDPSFVDRYIHNIYDNPKFINDLSKKFAEKLHASLTKNTQKPINYEIMDFVFRAAIKRQEAHGVSAYEWRSDGGLYKDVENKPTHIPTIPEAEAEYKQAQDKLTKYYRESAIDKDSIRQALRITSPITFSGANRIKNIIEIPKEYDKPFILQYGTSPLPSQFMEDLRSSGRDFYGLIDVDSNILMKSSQD